MGGEGGGEGVVDVSCICVWANVHVCICHSHDHKKIFLASKDKNKVLKFEVLSVFITTWVNSPYVYKGGSKYMKAFCTFR